MPDMQLKEVGMAKVLLSALPAVVVACVQLDVLPRLGASPDGEAMLGPGSCKIIREAMLHDELM